MKYIPGYEGYYSVDEQGNVYCNRTTGIKRIKTVTHKNGYVTVCLFKNPIKCYHSVHRLVAIAFISNQENKKEVNHKNGIKTDNRVENLEWATRSENRIHCNRKLDKYSCRSRLCLDLLTGIYYKNGGEAMAARGLKYDYGKIRRGSIGLIFV